MPSLGAAPLFDAAAFQKWNAPKNNNVKAWSYSRYRQYKLCPAQFYGEAILKLGKQENQATSRGELVHKATANFLTGKGAMPPEIKDPFHKHLYTEMAKLTDVVVEQQWGFDRTWEPCGWFGPTTWFRQVCDFGTVYEDGTSVELVDHKTGKRYDTNDDQMELQALSTFCHFKPALEVTTRLTYLDVGHEADEIRTFTRADVPGLKEKWERNSAPMFTDTIFAPRPNDRCRFCVFSRSNNGPCRFG